MTIPADPVTAADAVDPAIAEADIAVTVTDDIAADPMGLLSDQDPSTVGLELAYNTDLYGVSFAYTDDDAGGVEGLSLIHI